MTTIRVMLTIAAIAIVGCTGPTRGGVRPAPPGPRDIVHGVLFGDFSRLCPRRYDFCSDGRRSICCPSGACCEDASGPYCCGAYTGGRPSYDYDDDRDTFADRDARNGHGPCGPNSTTCSRGGRVLCCADYEGCCSDDRGLLYCCAGDRRHGY
jgi:hypothetical protein